MFIKKLLGIVAALALIAACFLPWVTIESKNIVVTGVAAEGTSFGKPGYFHLIAAALYLVFLLINRLWSLRFNLFVCAANIGWAIRNYLIISACQMGECPVKHTAIYVLVPAALLMFVGCVVATPKLTSEAPRS